MPETCTNCRARAPSRQYHVHLSTAEVVEISLCEGCRYKFVTADWVDAVV
ncbi:hypothetical protein [Halobiforma nitratireducens]|uniref:Uncharacterized protein n=1 Tax=Halobiforma nitratireducens JCM 10879 TaxID=1227454 RepID=M0M7T8_9EURY|nr:hypothetical protein [Halobiforma nitratireducens]EMA41791.1 hypothetical protein C446_05730 [Halobiforma nitratireducens JCM 10879]